MPHKVRDVLVSGVRNPINVIRFLMSQDLSEIPKRVIERRLKALSIEPRIIVEAGAYDGADTSEFLRIWPFAVVHAFEPIPELADAIRLRFKNSGSVRVYPYALSDVSSSRGSQMFTFRANDASHGSSSLLEASLHREIHTEIGFNRKLLVKTTTLDDWMRTNLYSEEHVDLLWLDVQGMEAKVLSAGQDFLRRTRMVHVEVSKRPLYDGACVFLDVHNILVGSGFRLVKKRIPVISGNALYIRD